MPKFSIRYDDRVQITAGLFGTWAAVFYKNGDGAKDWVRMWHRIGDDAGAMAEAVIRGDCPPSVFADYMDENPDPTSLVSGPRAAQMLREWVPSSENLHY